MVIDTKSNFISLISGQSGQLVDLPADSAPTRKKGPKQETMSDVERARRDEASSSFEMDEYTKSSIDE
jgi:hypothetical protein